jgi:hypothetical protein
MLRSLLLLYRAITTVQLGMDATPPFGMMYGRLRTPWLIDSLNFTVIAPIHK